MRCVRRGDSGDEDAGGEDTMMAEDDGSGDFEPTGVCMMSNVYHCTACIAWESTVMVEDTD
jgi:hypothetical protein